MAQNQKYLKQTFKKGHMNKVHQISLWYAEFNEHGPVADNI